MALTVVQVVPAMEMGGVERGTLEVATELGRLGHRAIVISAGGRLVPDLQAAGTQHVTWSIGDKTPLTLRFVPRLRRLLAEEKVDILHARSRLPAWVAYLAWRGMACAQRPRFVTTVHGPHSVNAYSAVMVRGERVIAISDTIRDYILANYPVTPARIRVIYRGIDPGFFRFGYQPDKSWRDGWRRDFPTLEGKKLLTLPARVTRRKGHSEFIELIAALVARRHPVHGLIMGGAHPRKKAFLHELKQRVESRRLQDHISFLGPRADIRDIMAISDLVLCIPSQPEGFGRTTVEALALGVPVVGYDYSGVGETLARIFPDGRVPPHDLSAMIEKVETFLASPPTIPPDQPYTLRKMLDETVALYEELSNGPR